MVGPAVLTFVKELGEFYGARRPPARSSASSTASRPSTSPAPASSSSRARHFWEGHPRSLQPGAPEFETVYRAAVGVDDNGASVADPQGRLDLRPHVLDLGDALRHQGGDGGLRLPGPRRPPGDGRGDRGDDRDAAGPEHPQGDKVFNGKTHQVFGHQSISRVEGGRLAVVHTTSIEDGLYPDEVDYTTMSF